MQGMWGLNECHIPLFFASDHEKSPHHAKRKHACKTSRYLEIIYLTLCVKFVAIQERVNPKTSEGTEIMPFHNIFNKW